MTEPGNIRQRQIDEILEAVWSAGEEEKRAEAGSISLPYEETPLLIQKGMQAALEEAIRQGLLTTSGDTELGHRRRHKGGKGEGLRTASGDILLFTDKGYERARSVVRRHRLAERLLSDVLDLERDEVESTACRFEHILSPEATNSICILLGHPTTCPHGKLIPEGECCRRRAADVRPLVMPATWLKVGEKATVAYLSTRAAIRLQRMATLGILPGSRISLVQRRPSYVIRVDETQLALDDAIVKEIYVKRTVA